MATGNDPVVEGFVGCVRFAWAVHLMLVQDGNDVNEITTTAYSNDMKSIFSCLEAIFANNVFQFWLDKILRSAAYQVGDLFRKLKSDEDWNCIWISLLTEKNLVI